MTCDIFLDSNILVYAAVPSDNEEHKQSIANSIIENVQFGLSAQVLQEFYVVTQRVPTPLSQAEAKEWLEMLEEFPCVAVDPGLVNLGIEVSQRYQISYWDGAIIAAAELLGAETLYTEDLNHEQIYGSVQAVNPFIG